MSAIINMIMMLGMFGVGIYLLIHRCDVLNLCDQSASAAPSSSSSDSSSGGGTTSPATAADNGKQCSSGCCTCIQTSPTDISCKTTGGNVLHLTSGSLSLADQCSYCAKNSCAGNQLKIGSSKKCGCCSCKQTDVGTITCSLSDGTKRKLDFTGGLSLDTQCDACHKLCQSSKAAKPVSAKKQAIANKPIDFSVPAGVSLPKCSNVAFCNKNSPSYNPTFCAQAKCTSGYARSSNYAYVPRRTYFADAQPRNPFKSHMSYI